MSNSTAKTSGTMKIVLYVIAAIVGLALIPYLWILIPIPAVIYFFKSKDLKKNRNLIIAAVVCAVSLICFISVMGNRENQNNSSAVAKLETTVSTTAKTTTEKTTTTSAKSTKDTTTAETTAISTSAATSAHTKTTTTAQTTTTVQTTTVQPTATAAAVVAPAETTVSATTSKGKITVILNTSTKCYHLSSTCRAAKKILPENYQTIEVNDLSEVTAMGYEPCGICTY